MVPDTLFSFYELSNEIVDLKGLLELSKHTDRLDNEYKDIKEVFKKFSEIQTKKTNEYNILKKSKNLVN
jgi:hypothetical protein